MNHDDRDFVDLQLQNIYCFAFSLAPKIAIYEYIKVR